LPTRERAAALHKKLKYIETPVTAFDVLKGAVEDRLLERFPLAAERLMIAFVRVANPSPEEWSQALTSCRRFIEALADGLFPPQDTKFNGRDVSQTHYINRLWAFIERSLESETDREMAKRHVEFLGLYLEKTYKKTNQGVHAEIDQRTATICVFHCYLLAAAILDQLDPKPVLRDAAIDISSASLDDMESILGIPRKVAKEIVKLRVSRKITEQTLKSVPGLSPRTFERIKNMVRYES
jgi:helix-hairpin-helix protein